MARFFIGGCGYIVNSIDMLTLLSPEKGLWIASPTTKPRIGFAA
jgi:hypothetical protein